MPKWKKLTQWPWKWLVISIILATIDQITKAWAINYLHPRETVPILSWLALHLCYNPGIGFSLLANASDLLIMITSISIVLITYKLYNTYRTAHSALLPLGFSCILGGGLGNLYDRFKLGVVVDFIGIYCLQWKTPIFNLADVFVNIGVVLIILAELVLLLNAHRVS